MGRTAPAHPPCNGHAAPRSPPAPPDGYSPEILAIFAVLERRRGAAAAITAPAIAGAAGLWPDLSPANRGTRVRKLLEQYQDFWPFPICGEADGYYLAQAPEELTHAYATLTSRGRCIFRRRRSLRLAALRAGFSESAKGRFCGKGVVPMAQKTDR